MAIKVRPIPEGGYEVDIIVLAPDGNRIRERRKSPAKSESETKRWAEQRERHLLREGKAKPKPAVEPVARSMPTLAEFVQRFIDGYVVAEKLKPSAARSLESIIRVHLVPALGSKKLEEIGAEDVAKLKAAMVAKSPKTVNNVLSALSKMHETAREWKAITCAPLAVKHLKVSPRKMHFYDFGEYETLVKAAAKSDPRTHLAVLLGGQAGLRAGEMKALRRDDISLNRNVIVIEQSDWRGHVTAPKGGRSREVPMTSRLRAALQAHRHLRGDLVLCEDDGKPLTEKRLQLMLRAAARLANVKAGIHILRHTFCSHLAMRGAPAKAIQELAGHADLSTTMRYMHLTPAALDGAIRLLEGDPAAIGAEVAR